MNLKITYRQLEMFAALMQSGKVTDAAHQIGITQPSASRLITDLEYIIGFDLFVRKKRRLHPTAEAYTLYDEVKRSFIGLQKIANAAIQIKQFKRGNLMIAGMPALALKFLPEVIEDFAISNPEITILLQTRSSDIVNQQIASGQFDLGFAAPDVNHPAVRKELLISAPLVAVLPLGHRLCNKDCLYPKDFESELFVSLGTNNNTRLEIDAIFITAGVARKTQLETQLSASACEIVSKGNFCTITEPIIAMDFAEKGKVVIKPFYPEQMFHYYVLIPTNSISSLVSNKFLEMVSQRIEEKVDSLFTTEPTD
ncbi:MAG: LysR family transcriptional regulator [Rhizobiales bacterium]|nr:LysR family transcriptional regulator [Hyphomicrobiales bacterium]